MSRLSLSPALVAMALPAAAEPLGLLVRESPDPIALRGGAATGAVDARPFVPMSDM
jgi:hypothetical protein